MIYLKNLSELTEQQQCDNIAPSVAPCKKQLLLCVQNISSYSILPYPQYSNIIKITSPVTYYPIFFPKLLITYHNKNQTFSIQKTIPLFAPHTHHQQQCNHKTSVILPQYVIPNKTCNWESNRDSREAPRCNRPHLCIKSSN